ncbi:MAG: hypothetical protein KDE31_20035, partial [Caldilineaceae bacterium]|nr:hypothetical protein [Caldilineaceae bacterium]
MATLINELSEQTAPICLVIDDLHYITDETIYAVLTYFVERLPPHVTVVIATRHDPPLPLAQLRARRELIEIRLAALRFTAPEAAELFNQSFGLALDSADLDTLLRRTEGWAAGMTLLATSLEGIPKRSERMSFLKQVGQSSRYIFDYLAESVFNREGATLQAFLLATAILDELTPALCAAVSGQANAGATLAALYRRNLFVIELDERDRAGQPVYRYHDLFRTFLRERLRTDTTSEQVRTWHCRAGEAEQFAMRKINHYLQAAAWEETAQQLETYGQQLLNNNSWQFLAASIETLPAELVAKRPRLQHLLGSIRLVRWQLTEALPLLAQAAQRFAAQDEPGAQGEALVALAVAQSLLGDVAAANVTTAQALALPIALASRVQLLTGRAWQWLWANEPNPLLADLDEAMALLAHSGDRQALHYFAPGFRAPLLAVPGALLRAERFVAMVEQWLPRTGAPARDDAFPTPHYAVNHGLANGGLVNGGLVNDELADDVLVQASLTFLRSMIATWRDEWALAERECAVALALSEDVGGLTMVGLEVEGYLQQALRTAMQGNWTQAQNTFDRLSQIFTEQAALRRDWQVACLYLYARAAWINEHFAVLHSLFAQMCMLQSQDEPFFNQPLRDEVRSLVLLTEGRIEEAITLLTEVA